MEKTGMGGSGGSSDAVLCHLSFNHLSLPSSILFLLSFALSPISLHTSSLMSSLPPLLYSISLSSPPQPFFFFFLFSIRAFLLFFHFPLPTLSQSLPPPPSSVSLYHCPRSHNLPYSSLFISISSSPPSSKLASYHHRLPFSHSVLLQSLSPHPPTHTNFLFPLLPPYPLNMRYNIPASLSISLHPLRSLPLSLSSSILRPLGPRIAAPCVDAAR